MGESLGFNLSLTHVDLSLEEPRKALFHFSLIIIIGKGREGKTLQETQFLRPKEFSGMYGIASGNKKSLFIPGS